MIDIDTRVTCTTCTNLRGITCVNARAAGLTRGRPSAYLARDFMRLKQHCHGHRDSARIVCSRCGREGHLPKDCRWPIARREAGAAA